MPAHPPHPDFRLNNRAIAGTHEMRQKVIRNMTQNMTLHPAPGFQSKHSTLL